MHTNPPSWLTPAAFAAGAVLLFAPQSGRADPLIDSWLRINAGQYARVQETNGGPSVTTWPSAGLPNMGGGQSQPAYADVGQIQSSADFVYIFGSGLASHLMGPWHNNGGGVFGNWPANQNYIRRFPRKPAAAAVSTVNGGGAIGLWVNGVAFFNLLDMYSYSVAEAQDVQQGQGAGGDGVWVRNAVAVEQPTFDKSNAHQPPSGEYHYHSNPTALRLQLGDNLAFDAAKSVYVEDLSSLRHSPILGWAFDGYPIYGPYGYATASDPASGVRRMVSGFILRDGSRGATDLAATGRHSLAAWAAALHGLSAALSPSQYGPAVVAAYPLGRYVEDYDFLGDLGYASPADYDLDVHNGRWCVTPEYPQGTYAYFVTIDDTGAGVFPYTIGRQYYGAATGGAVTSVSGQVITNFLGGPDTPLTLDPPKIRGDKSITIGWRAVEGGTYQVEASSDLSHWSVVATNLANSGLAASWIDASASQPGQTARFYRARLVSLAAYDATGVSGSGGGGGGGTTVPIASVTPNSAAPGATVTLSIVLGGQAPPAGLKPLSVTVGSIAATGVARNGATVTVTLTVPAGQPPGGLTVDVVFPGPAGSGDVTFTLVNGFSIP